MTISRHTKRWRSRRVGRRTLWTGEQQARWPIAPPAVFRGQAWAKRRLIFRPMGNILVQKERESMLGVVENPDLDSLVQKARTRLQRVIEALGG